MRKFSYLTNNDVNFIQIFGVIKILQYICIQKNLNVNQMVNAYCDIKNSVDTAKREGIAEGMEIGMKEGMEKGMNQKALEIAKNMLAMGLSAEQVAKATQLPLEIIKNLSNS
jgi:predicted transposase/invertase (TIGR01784 family)